MGVNSVSAKYFKVHKTVLLSWIASYALVLFIPLIINSAIYIQSTKIIEKQITDSNTSMLQQFQKEIDGHVQEIENLGLRISVNQKLDTLIKAKDEKEILSSFTLVKQAMDMNDEFSAYALSSRFVESVYIFFNNKDLVWWHSNLYDKKTFYDKYIDNENTSYEKWLKSMNERYININSPFYIKGYDKNSQKTIAHFQSLPINLTSIQANLVITMDAEKLNDYIQNVSKINNSFVYILDKNNNLLFSSDENSKLLPSTKYDEMNESIGIIHKNLDKQDVVVSYISSKASEWKYVCVIPNSVFKEKVVYVRNLTIICFLICIILGGAVIVLLAKKNYNPLKELVNSLKSKYDDNKNKNLNEFSLIKNSIMDAYSENEFISQKLESQNNALRLNFISRLLRGRFNGNPPHRDTLNSYGISFDSENFIVIIFYIEQSSELKLEEIDSKVFENIIINELKALVEDKANIYQAEVDDMIACILNVKEYDLDNWRENIDSIINRLQDILKEKLKLNFTVALSGLNKHITGINIGYQEAMEAMEYRLFSKDNNIIYYDDIKLLQNRSYNYYYTIENEQKLINSIKVGNYEKAKEIVDAVIYENFSARILSINMSKCVMFDLISTFIKALNNEGALEEMRFLEDNNFIGRVLTRKSIEDMKFELLSCLKTICDYMYEYNQDKSKNKLTEKINAFIEENYADPNLNVSTLADQVGMNSKYIAALYKDSTGESILDLINKIRVNNAKHLLKQDMSIAEAAEKVGFSNSNALIRAFKKCEGITPGQFKEVSKN
jgi:two-component system response regulator YesN